MAEDVVTLKLTLPKDFARLWGRLMCTDPSDDQLCRSVVENLTNDLVMGAEGSSEFTQVVRCPSAEMLKESLT